MRHSNRTVGLFSFMMMLCLALIAEAASAAPEYEMTPDAVRSGSLLLRMKSGYEVATRINSEVEISVSGMTSSSIGMVTSRSTSPAEAPG